MRILKLIDRALARVEGWLIVLFLFLVIAFTFFQIVLRSLYTHAGARWASDALGQVDWADPLVRLLALWIAFLGASLLTRDSKHIKIDLMTALLPSRWLPFRDLVLSTVCVFISALMLKTSLEYVKMEMTFGGDLFLNVPTWAGQLILPAGFSLILFRFSLRALEQVRAILTGVET